MARRGRGSSARTKATPGGRDAAVHAARNPVEPGDEPGARTIGAMALKRWVARGPGRDVADDGGDGPRTHGPFDEDDLADAADEPARVDFGAVRVPVPRGGEVSVEPEDGRLQAVHVMLPAGRLSVSALAAPRTERLWPDLAAEIDESLREGGATVRSFTGEWGRELHARTGDASSLFVGVDGPRWMLYGVATGPTSAAAELDAALRAMLRGTVVVRGRSPYPVRTVLPLTVPDELPGAGIAPERVPVPRTPVERGPGFARPVPPVDAPIVDAPTTITTVSGVDTVPHGIPGAVPDGPGDDRDAGRPAYRAEPAARTGPAADHPHGIEADAGSDAETGVSRTASRGLFRRKPERPAQRPPQRRVADLLAQAERDRAEAARGGLPARPAPGPEETADATAPGSRRDRPVPHGRAVSNGHTTTHDGSNGFRTNGFVPREPAHDRRPTNGAVADTPARDVAGGDAPSPYPPSPHARSPHDSSGLNGSGFASDGPGGYDGHAAGPYADGSWLDEPPANGSYGHGATVDEPPLDATRVNGRHDPWSLDVEPPAPVWPAAAEAHRPSAEPGVDLRTGTEVGGIEATVWAALALGGSHSSSGLAADGSDDWTLPLPVVRSEPEPEPARPDPYPQAHRTEARNEARSEAPRGRRARREAEERAAEERGTPDRWTPEPYGSDRWAPTASGAHSTDRPRHTRGHREPEAAADEYPPQQAARWHSRHAEERDDVRDDGAPGGHADRARHRRPGH